MPTKTAKSAGTSTTDRAPFLPATSRAKTLPVRLLPKGDAKDAFEALPEAQKRRLKASGWEPTGRKPAVLWDADGACTGAILPIASEGAHPDFAAGALPTALPEGNYHFEGPKELLEPACLAWALGAYRFDRYKPAKPRKTQLKLPKGLDRERMVALVEGAYLAQDLVNTPASDMGPQELEDAARALAKRHKARAKVIVGDKLLQDGFPMIHAVGRASVRPPRLIDLTWGRARDPKVTLIGKGICFDTGGLDLKPASAMALMKKDMGGAATVLGLAHIIMALALRVRLRVLIPAAENSVSGSAFRPGDVLHSRKGLTVEIGNTDAEGRLVLADALALADDEKPDLIADFATLTGSARVALGPDVPPMYTDDTELAESLLTAAARTGDPLWRMPLWRGYDADLSSDIADVNHISPGPFAGSITAALFLNRFVEAAKSWVHFDIFAWSPKDRPGRPKGAAFQGARALFEVLDKRYGRAP